jgi:hypothetical protein
MLTVYVIRSESADIDKLITSFGDIDFQLVLLDNPPDFNKKPDTKWKMFLYSNEYLEDDLQTSLKEYLQQDVYDYFNIYSTKDHKFYVSPRLFKKEVVIENHTVYPKSVGLQYTSILDGFIICQ